MFEATQEIEKTSTKGEPVEVILYGHGKTKQAALDELATNLTVERGRSSFVVVGNPIIERKD